MRTIHELSIVLSIQRLRKIFSLETGMEWMRDKSLLRYNLERHVRMELKIRSEKKITNIMERSL
jgi:hypothetical protein